MVVFTCNHCGETLHKPKVDKHYQFQCRNFKSVTCVDCFKDFRNEEYVVHTKCITEDERYAAKGTFKNGIIKKGEVKQESWVEMIKYICDTDKDLKPSVKKLLETISSYDNVPRKRVKFLNFIKSSSGNRVNMADIQQTWDVIEKYKNKEKIVKQENCRKRSIANSDEQEPKKVKLIKENTDYNEKFNYKTKILAILKEKDNISMKKLQKKIIKLARAHSSVTDENEEKYIKKFTKKLGKIPNVQIENGRVSLLIE